MSVFSTKSALFKTKIIGLSLTTLTNSGFMQLLGDVDVQDATLEFRRIFEEA